MPPFEQSLTTTSGSTYATDTLASAGLEPATAITPRELIVEFDLSSTGADRYPSEPLDELTELEAYGLPDWDGFGALPITGDTIRAARRFLRALPPNSLAADIAPGSDGTIGFQWEGAPDQIEHLFIEIGPGELVGGSWRDHGTRQRQPTRSLTFGMYQLLPIVQRLVRT